MSSDSFEPKFNIRRIPRDGAAAVPPTTADQPKPASIPKKEMDPPVASNKKQPKKAEVVKPAPAMQISEEALPQTGGRFITASATLAFLGTLAGSRLTTEATLRRAPNGDWWAETPASPESAADLAIAAGGTAYALSNQRWVRVTATGRLPERKQDQVRLDVESWPQIEIQDLLAKTQLSPQRLLATSSIHIIAAGALGRWAIERCLRQGLQVQVTPVLRQPLSGGTDEGALWLQVAASSEDHAFGGGAVAGTGSVRRQSVEPLSVALISAIAGMPYVTVARSVTTSSLSILVDVRCRAPSILSMMSDLANSDEVLVLGPVDLGHWRIKRNGSDFDANELVGAPDLAVRQPPAIDDFALPDPVPARLVYRPGVTRSADAVLLDDEELNWLRLFLPFHPSAERAFLIPGSGRHLMLASGGLAESLPFGTPLIFFGPNGLFVERGCEFLPPLPEAARASCFHLADDSVVGVVRGGAFRFMINQLTPAWTLWAGKVPEIRNDLSDAGKNLLVEVTRAYEQQLVELPPNVPLPQKKQPARNRSKLLKESAEAEARGQFQRAAELLEEAGLHGPAGRMFETAARNLR